jgi:hypothetical protein
MRTVTLQLLTWGTIACAVTSAAWLASTDPAPVLCSVGDRSPGGAPAIELPLPSEPTGSGKSKAAGPGPAGSGLAVNG